MVVGIAPTVRTPVGRHTGGKFARKSPRRESRSFGALVTTDITTPADWNASNLSQPNRVRTWHEMSINLSREGTVKDESYSNQRAARSR